MRKTLSSQRRQASGSRASSSCVIRGGGVSEFTVSSHNCRGKTVFSRNQT